jgi:hypothetical protein
MRILLICGSLVLATIVNGQKKTGFKFVEKLSEKRIEVLYNGRLLTAFRFDDSIAKQVLYPVNTVDGITVTRGYPLEPRPGDRTDHPHHIGIWMNYESVNGLDFWNNSTAIPPDKRDHYGRILFTGVDKEEAKGSTAKLSVTAKWVRPGGELVLNEKTTYTFSVVNNDFFIDRATTLTAGKDTAFFKDVKDGFFAIRVARELEQPSNETTEYIDAQGNKTSVPGTGNASSTGLYTSSNGLKGDAVWSTQGEWVMLQGVKDAKKVTIGMLDHPGNIGYPAYWHARGYGLFAVNPLGRAVFSKGKENLNLVLAPGQSANFRYKVIVSSGRDITSQDMNNWAKQFN